MLRAAITIWVVLFLVAIGHADSLQPAVVVVSQAEPNEGSGGCCSGVCVDPAGLVLTAKHCGAKPRVTIWFPTLGNRTGRLIYASSEAEGPLVSAIYESGQYPSFEVAPTKPEIGDAVTAAGYPFCNRDGYVENVGEVIGGLDGSHGGEYAGVRFNVMNRPSVSGMSGGPLLNAKRQIVGLCHGTDFKDSFWITWTATRAAVVACQSGGNPKAAHESQRPQLVAFCVERCSDCITLEKDAAAGMLGEIVIVKRERGAWDKPELVAECELTTGKRMQSFPVAWVRGTTKTRTGYKTTSRDGLLQWFGNVGQSVGQIFVGRPDPPADPRWKAAPKGQQPDVVPPADAPPVPIETPPDWSTVSIIVLAAKQDVGMVRGMARSVALKKSRGLVERRINEHLDGKAQLQLIDERTQPNRYAAICEAARIEADPVAVIVLVRQLPIGLKGLIAGKVEKILAGMIPEGLPVDVIFERGHQADFANVVRGLLMPDGLLPYDRESTPPLPVPDPISDGGGARGEGRGASVPAEPRADDASLVNKIVSQIGDVIDEKLDAQEPAAETPDDVEKKSLPARVIAFVLSLLGVSHATGGIRGFIAAKAREAIKDKIGDVLT